MVKRMKVFSLLKLEFIIYNVLPVTYLYSSSNIFCYYDVMDLSTARVSVISIVLFLFLSDLVIMFPIRLLPLYGKLVHRR